MEAPWHIFSTGDNGVMRATFVAPARRLEELAIALQPARSNFMKKTALVMLSGGHVSAAALLLASLDATVVGCVHFDTGPGHAESYRAARAVAEHFGVPLLPPVAAKDTSLVKMVSAALVLATELEIDQVWAGINDSAWDRPALEEVFEIIPPETAESVEVVFPFQGANASVPLALALQHGHLDFIAESTHSCASRDRKPHAWGHGCGECPRCMSRADAWSEFEGAMGLLK